MRMSRVRVHAGDEIDKGTLVPRRLEFLKQTTKTQYHNIQLNLYITTDHTEMFISVSK